PGGGFFGSTSVWKKDVTTAPVHANSAAMVSGLAQDVTSRYGGIAAFNVWQYNTSVYTVSSTQAKVDVKFDDCQGKGYVPKGLTGPGGQFTQVPIPSGAVTAAGTDAQLTIYSPASDQLWEFWKAKKVNGTWQACWGGRIDKASTSYGYFLNGFGASATGLATSAGAVSVKDAQAGAIDHAIALAIPSPANWKNFSWPAQRSDGSSTAANAIPEGSRLRLDPRVNVDALNLTPVAKMVAKAAQKYGFIVTDKAGAVSVVAESGAGLKAATGTDPWTGLLAGTPSYQVMRNFPWNKLQVLPKDHGKPAG
ncbi:DUF4124 domain-containing protein, partial [Kineococcus indalonis]|uniref:DUF4124 domain-containing protein n=1 Tax=Kineococcus indalonis TaxID=2696566 RepID=UPI001411F6EA